MTPGKRVLCEQCRTYIEGTAGTRNEKFYHPLCIAAMFDQENQRQAQELKDKDEQIKAMLLEIGALSERANNRVITCVYCGHAYPNETPTSGAEVLTQHIRICQAHPMRVLEQQLAVMRRLYEEANQLQSYQRTSSLDRVIEEVSKVMS